MLKKSRSMVTLAAVLTLLVQLYLCFFFDAEGRIPRTGDHNPANYTRWRFLFPATGFFDHDYWYGFGVLPVGLDPLGILTWMPTRLFFTTTFAICAVALILGYYRFAREVGFRRDVSALGGLFLAWQGDYLGFVSPGHYGNAPQWALVPWMMWLALRAMRRESWYLAALCGGLTGATVSLLPDRGALFALLVAGLYGYEAWHRRKVRQASIRYRPLQMLALTIFVALLTAAPSLAAAWKISGEATVKGSSDDPVQKYAWATAYSFPPEETITYLVPGFFGWSTNHPTGPYWGRVGSDPKNGLPPFSLGEASLGTIPTLLALAGILALCLAMRREPSLVHLFANFGSSGGSSTSVAEVQASISSEPRSAEKLRARATPLAYFFLAACVITYLLSLGKFTPVHWFFYELPFQEHWRNPIKFLAPFNFCAVYLATYGMEWLAGLLEQEEASRQNRDFLFALRFLALAAGTLVLGFVLFFFPLRIALKTLLEAQRSLSTQGQDPAAQMAQIDPIISTSLQTLGVAAIEACLLLGLVWIGLNATRCRQWQVENPLVQKAWNWMLAEGNRGSVVLALAGLSVIPQMAWMHSQNLTPEPASYYLSPNPIVESLKKDQDLYRVAFWGQDPFGFRQQLLGRFFPVNHISSLDHIAISRTPRDYGAYFAAVQSNWSRHYFLGGVKYLLGSPSALEELEQSKDFHDKILGGTSFPGVPKGPDDQPVFACLVFKDHMEKVTLIPALETFHEEKEMFMRLADAKWNPRQSALLVEPPNQPFPETPGIPQTLSDHTHSSTNVEKAKSPFLPPPLLALPPDSNTLNATNRLTLNNAPESAALESGATLQINRYDTHGIEFQAITPKSMIALINDYDDKDWQATVNQQPVPVLRLNGIMHGLVLPSGTSTVIVRYRPSTVAVNLGVAAWAALLLGALILHFYSKNFRTKRKFE